MITLLRAICISTCLVAGIYYSILVNKEKDVRRGAWFPILCYVSAINMSLRLAYKPSVLTDSSVLFGVEDNIYLVTLMLMVLATNFYNGLAVGRDTHFLPKFFNYFCMITSMGCFIVSKPYAGYLYVFCLLIAAVAYLYGIYSASVNIKKSKTYLLSLFSYSLMVPAIIIDAITIISGHNYISFRIFFTPVFLMLHSMMTALQYNESLKKTQALAKSLTETIEKINHSNNAIECTQMKPDFLYSTLAQISDLCLTDSFDAEDVTIALSKYLRHTLNFQQLKGIVPLANEIELIKAYSTIETKQHKNVTVEYKIPDIVPQVYVPPLSIQPLIENSIEHGIKDEATPLKITVSVIPYKDYCHIDVSDNGKGISEEMLDGLPASYAQTARIGLYNIEKRLASKFGRGLVIQSAEGVGTSISFTVPPEGKYDLSDEEVTA